MIKKLTLTISVIVMGILLLGCEPSHSNKYPSAKRSSIVHTYYHPGNPNTVDDDVYWYVIYQQLSNSQTQAYYYISQTRVVNLASTSFSRSPEGRSLPSEVEKEIQDSVQEPDQSIQSIDAPAELQADEAAVDAAQGSSDNSSTADTSSSDSGGDSGGGGE